MNDENAVEEIDEVETTEVDSEVEEIEEDSDEAAEGEEDPSEPSAEKKDEDAAKKDKDGVQKRIDEITRLRRDEERQRLRVEQENAELRRQIEAAVPKQPAGMKLADFDYDEDRYSAYLTEQAAGQARQEAQRAIQAEKQMAKQADFNVKETDYAIDVTDYHAVTRNPTLKLSPEMVQVAQDSDDGPKILYYLGKHPDVSERLANMSPLAMAREIGRIEATKLDSVATPSITNAPAPAAKLKSAAKSQTISTTSPESDKLSTEEWFKRERKRLANKRA